MLSLLVTLVASAPAAEAQIPPYVKVSPGNTTILGSPSVNVTIEYCYTDSFGYGDPKVFVNSVDMTSSATITSITPPPGCDQAQQATITVTAPAFVVGRYNTVGTNFLVIDQATYETARAHRDVRVDPQSQHIESRANATFGANFTIVNTGAAADTFTVTASCSGAALVGSCSPSASSVALAAGASTTVGVANSSASTVGAQGLITLSATATSDGSVTESTWSEVVVVAAPSRAVIARATEDIDRSACVTLALAPNANYECGDLRLVHALPSTTRYNRTRTPALLYSAQTAAPVPAITADITPSVSVQALIICAGSTSGASNCIAAGPQIAGTTRRFSVLLPNWTAATGRYGYTINVLGYVTFPFPSYVPIGSDVGSIAVVNRSSSPYGAGWWLTGIDQVFGSPASNDTLLLVGADASTRMFAYAGTTSGIKHFVARALDRPDTIHFDGSQMYRRLEDDRYTTSFSGSTGLYTGTTSSFGQAVDSCASYNGSGGCTSWAMGAGYTLHYGTRLDSIVAPANGSESRVVVVAMNGTRIGSITDPDGRSVSFAYDSTSAVVRSHTDKRGKVTAFTHLASRVSSVTRDSATSGLKALTTISPIEYAQQLGLPLTDTYVSIDGPRTDVDDVSRIWSNAHGAPLRIRDPHGRETEIEYDSTWTMLVRRTRNPLRLVSDAFYNARGLTDSVRVIGRLGGNDTATTRMQWDPIWRRTVAVRDPVGLLDTTAIYPTYGVPLWQQRGTNIGRRVSFSYHTSGAAAGQVSTVSRPPSGATDSLFYDGYGNLSGTRSALGYLSLLYRDDIGRETMRIDPIDAIDATDSATVVATGTRTITRYDVMGRPDTTLSIGPERTSSRSGSPADTLWVLHSYDDEGNRTGTTRRYRERPGAAYTTALHSWSYDALGRVLTETQPTSSGGSMTFAYDSSGNVKSRTNGRGQTLSMKYDALGRLTRRIVPEVTQASEHCSTFPSQSPLCMYSFPTRLSSVCIPADTMRYRYDAAGNTVNADNRWARVRRTFTPAGLVATDTLRTRTWYVRSNDACEEPDSVGYGALYSQRFNTHVYGTGYAYDIAGRLDSLLHPNAIDPCSGRCAQRYRYHAESGLLDSVIDFAGRAHQFVHDNGGRMTSWIAPGGFTDSRVYDADDRLRIRTLPALVADTMYLDAQGRIVQVGDDPFGNAASVAYGGLGAVIQSDNLGDGTIDEDFRVNALGSRWFQARRASRASGHVDRDRMRVHTYDVRGRLLLTADSLHNAIDSLQFDYLREQQFDGSDNVFWRGERERDFAASTSWYDGLRMYYGADDKLALANRHGGISAVSDDSRPGSRGVWEMHRYDALGRRVMTHAVRGSSCPASSAECASVVERTVWDGDQLFYEIRTPDTTPANDLPSGGTYNAYGRVAYLHAGSIDAPLAVTRMDLSGQPAEVTVAPHAGWQGSYVGGSLMNGTSQEPCTGASGCPLIDWPGAKQTADGLPINPPSNAWWGRLINEQLDGSGLKYQRNRFYDPTTGQFTQADPIGLSGGVNLYAFAGGDPVNFGDPYGLCPWPPSSCLGREGADLALGSTPVVSTLLDAATLVSGKNLVTGEDASRILAFAGLVGPAGSAHFRAGGKALDGLGDIAGGSATVREALDGAVKWLGDGYTEFRKNIFRSKDGTRQFRMQPSDLTDKKQGPHVHFESIGPDGRKIMENSHVKLKDR